MRSSIAVASLATLAASVAAQTTSTVTAPPVGSTLASGAYVCNPAHQYPSGQSCDGSGATPTLVTLTTTPYPAGSTLSNGGYVCNPAHQYPSGQSCDGSGATPTLVTLTGESTTAAMTTAKASGTDAANTWAQWGTTTTSAVVSKWTGAASANQAPMLGAVALGMVALFA